MIQRMALLVCLAVMIGCGAARTGPTTAPRGATAATLLPDSVRWVQGAAEYVASFEQVYRQAVARVEREAAGRAAGSWGVVLDADETVLNNSVYQAERAALGQAFTPESWAAWVRRREATPLPGARPFLSRVRALGGKIAIVTNRLGSECADTEAVLQRHTLVYDAILCRPDGTPSDKNPRFEAVAAGRAPGIAAPIEVVAFVGDNILDFPRMSQQAKTEGSAAFAEFGVRFFILPNPMYGSWQ
jgi:5'-nucleotidase (lipoprotein e(P4) family)